ncbi:MAG: PAS domain S-box protein [Ignavibacteriales bacterium]|nr:PAS domain S-box protein [Ignavibacteriales bacterium]
MDSTLDKTFDFTKSDLSFRDALESAPVGILIFDGEFLIKYINKNFFRFNGVVKGVPADVAGKSIYEYRIFEDIDIRKDLNELRGGSAFEKELITSRTLSGSKISIVIKCVPVFSGSDFYGGIIIIEDVKISSAATEILQIHSQSFQNFLYLISDFFFFVDAEGNIKTSLPKNYDDYPILFESDISKSSKHPSKLSNILFKKLLDAVVSGRKTIEAEIPFFKGTKEERLKVTLIPMKEEESKVEIIIALVKNITGESGAKVFADEEIKELRRYQHMITNILDGVVGLDKGGKITFWNESAAKLFGLTRSEVHGKFIGKIFNQITSGYFEKLKTELAEQKLWEGQFKIGEDDSIAEVFAVRIGVLHEDAGDNFIMLCSNITSRDRLERELRQSEQRFRNVVTNSHEYICILDPGGKITYANPYFLETFQYSEEEITSLNFSDLVDTLYLASRSFNLNEIISYNTRSLELPLINKPGQRIHVLASFSAVSDIGGTVEYYNVILTDITLKKESEKDLLLIRSLFEASHDGIALISKKRFVLVNDSFVRMFGYRSASEIIGQDPFDFMDAKDIHKVKTYIDSIDGGKDFPTRYDFTGKRRNNSSFEVEISVSTYETDEEKFIVWVLRDVTEEKKAQEAMQISEERYRSISENINESFWTGGLVNGELNTEFFTPAIKKISGYSDDAFAKDSSLWKKIIHPDDAEEFENRLQKFLADQTRIFESFEYRILDLLGNTIWIENKINLKRNPQGVIQKVYGTISDITLAKKADEDLKKSARDLKELNEAKDRFISIISHDLRTPFTSILGFTDFLLTDEDLPKDKQEQYVKFIQESAKSMLGLVNSLLDWTRLQTGRIKFEPERINSRIIVQKVIQILSGAAIQKNISLISEIDKDIFIHADESLLLQAFNNLVSNAIKFTKDGGSIRISADVNIEKRQIEFAVKDEGVGIRSEDLSKLFKVDAKFTTPGTAGEKGSGLGLSLVHDIITKHGGEIWVESEVGKGTKFIFSMPVASSNLLLVDDIKTDRLLYVKLLKSIVPNYNILEAENGKQAFDIIKQSSPALVITDHKMPLMSGYDLVKQINVTDLKYRPPVIILSSDINHAIESEYKELGVEFIFQKPVNLGNFKNAIEKSLRKAVFS